MQGSMIVSASHLVGKSYKSPSVNNELCMSKTAILSILIPNRRNRKGANIERHPRYYSIIQWEIISSILIMINSRRCIRVHQPYEGLFKDEGICIDQFIHRLLYALVVSFDLINSS